MTENFQMEEYILYKFKNNKFILECINNLSYLSIGGSTVLQIIQNEYYKDSDLDIYIDLNLLINNNFEINKALFIKLLIELIRKRYNDRYLITEYNLDIQNILRKIYNYINNEENENDIINPYLNMNRMNNILFVHSLYYLETKIDLIFIKCNIHTHIINDYDLDIVKNYYNLKTIYCHNRLGIKNKIARLDKEKIKYALLESRTDHIIIQWFQRYYKYIKRGFKIFIKFNVELTKYDCDYILKLFQTKSFNTDIRGIFNISINNLNNSNYIYVNFKRYVYLYLQMLIKQKQKNISKRIMYYSYYILDDYCNPKSECMQYIIKNFENDENMEEKQIIYLNSKKKMKFLKLK